ncbi:MAG: enoyl-CoA hydratase/isomerase [Candidatus Eremiobacteraeota bacterium]|jgi:enoyl-CoA hydratase/carnithine racemase|nr:enoyl-CoA hydratase/isomerase [Candidatus Eremiobacteraeota bacterium]
MDDVSTARVRSVHASGVTFVELADPERKNVLDDSAIADLHAALDAANPREVLVLRGAGDGFSVGRPHAPGGHPKGPEAARRALEEVVRLNLRVLRWEAPTLAVVQGFAHGAALGLVQQCDVAVASSDARFSFPEATYNLPPGLVASYLRRFVNEKSARFLVMTGEEVDAERAREMGLISQVVERGALDDTATRITDAFVARLEAEIALKASLAALTPWFGDIEDAMHQGLQAVVRWASRPK